MPAWGVVPGLMRQVIETIRPVSASRVTSTADVVAEGAGFSGWAAPEGHSGAGLACEVSAWGIAPGSPVRQPRPSAAQVVIRNHGCGRRGGREVHWGTSNSITGIRHASASDCPRGCPKLWTREVACDLYLDSMRSLVEMPERPAACETSH